MENYIFDVYNISYDDPETWDLICSGNTKGIFQLESGLGKSWAKRVRPKNLEELAALTALLRPGCLKAIVDGKSMTQHYVDRKHGREEITYVHESLEPILNKTQGVLVYQEQSMKIAQKIAGFNLQEADDLRKAIGKKKADLMSSVKDKFIKGAENESVVSKEAAEEIFGWIEKSSRYAFNKSHAVSYAICGYWSAYAKAHHTVEFFCHCLRHAKNKPDSQQETRELVSDAKVNDIYVHPPSLKAVNEETSIIDGRIHFGLTDVKSVGINQIKKLKQELRAEEETLNKSIDEWGWYDFLVRLSSKITSSTVCAMISVGMFSQTGISRSKMLDEFDTWSKLTDKERSWVYEQHLKWENLEDALISLAPTKKMGGGTFNDKRKQVVSDLIKQIQNPSYSLEDTPDWIAGIEQNYLGVPITYSKVDSCDTSAANATCKDFLNGEKKNVSLAVSINSVRPYTIKKGKNKGSEMAFLSVEDGSSPLENIAIFTDQWLEYKNLLYEGNTVMLTGSRSSKGGYEKNDSLVVNRVRQI